LSATGVSPVIAVQVDELDSANSDAATASAKKAQTGREANFGSGAHESKGSYRLCDEGPRRRDRRFPRGICYRFVANDSFPREYRARAGEPQRQFGASKGRVR
jgi:hypothetical protein